MKAVLHTPTETAPSEAVIDRIRALEEQRSGARINSHRHRQLTLAIRVEADAYRRALDTEQAGAKFDPHPRGRAQH